MAMLRRPAFAILIIIISAMVAAASSSSSLVTFIFGDSLTEVGNNNYLQYSLARSDFPWYGVDFSGGQATGRFTNGRTIGDVISARLGIPSPPPYLSLSRDDDKLLGGVNYASGGAGILNETGLYFIQRLSFDDQIKCFENTKEAIKAKVGRGAANKLCNEALYFIGIGSNDYVNNFLQPFLADGQQYTHDEFLELLISTLDQQFTEELSPNSKTQSSWRNSIAPRAEAESKIVQVNPKRRLPSMTFPFLLVEVYVRANMRLYQLGARKMIYHGLGPLGCIPSQRVKSRTGQCLKQVNRWVLQFNGRVQNLVASLNRRLHDAQLIFADTYPAVFDLIANPKSYGFKVSNTSCCNVDTSIGGLCLPNSKMCRNRKDYVFWDAFHPSDAANALLADHLFSALFSLSPSPAPARAPSH